MSSTKDVTCRSEPDTRPLVGAGGASPPRTQFWRAGSLRPPRWEGYGGARAPCGPVNLPPSPQPSGRKGRK